MKFRKLVMECGIIAAALAVTSVPAVSVSAAETVVSLSGVVPGYKPGVDSESVTNLQETKEEEKSEWDGRLLVVVEEDSSLCIRTDANTDAEVVGKLYRGSGAEVIEQGEEWSKIVSGDVEGYVKNEYCVFGEAAEAQAKEICDTYASAKEDGIRVRSEANTDSTILTVLDAGQEVLVADTQDDAPEGWVQVSYNDTTAYIFAEYVDVEMEVGEAMSMEEIAAQQAAEAAKAAAASAASASSETASSAAATVNSNAAVSASTSDLTLLAAIIQCEAGGECYEGQLAVGAVIMNRVHSGSFPNSISGVIYQSGQFSPVASGKLARVLSSGNISSSCYQAAQAALGGADNTGGAKYFHAGSGNGTVIGNQVFY